MDQSIYKKYKAPRMRHHANSCLYLPLKYPRNEKVFYPDEIESVNWKDLFASGAPPAYLDIGCGLGKFMIETALTENKINILGLEVRLAAVDWVNEIIAEEKIPNAKALWYSVVNGVKFIESGSIQKAFYFFPDPWVKKKHHKRRAFSKMFLDEINRILSPEGKLYLMTDVEEVSDFQLEIINEQGSFNAEYVDENNWDLDVISNHEKFCKEKKIPFKRIKCGKVSNS